MSVINIALNAAIALFASVFLAVCYAGNSEEGSVISRSDVKVGHAADIDSFTTANDHAVERSTVLVNAQWLKQHQHDAGLVIIEFTSDRATLAEWANRPVTPMLSGEHCM